MRCPAWVGRAFWVVAALVLCSTVGLARESNDISSGGFARIDEGMIVRVKAPLGNETRIKYPDGRRRTVSSRRLVPVVGYPQGVRELLAGARRKLRKAKGDIAEFRGRLAKDFDSGFLEMMAACLSAQELPADPHDETRGCLTASREQSLQKLVADCKGYDVERFVVILSECDFCESFIRYAIDSLYKSKEQARRELIWFKAKVTSQTGKELVATNRKIATLEAVSARATEETGAIEGLAVHVADVRSGVDSLQNSYFKTYEKSADVARQYGLLREALARSESIASSVPDVLALADEYGKEFVRPETIRCVATAASAMTELQRRRAPTVPKVPDQAGTSGKGSARQAKQRRTPKQKSQEKGGGGCFIATAVYGSYDHPDVIVLRRFRDTTLQSCVSGREFIAWYYRNGPEYAEWLRSRPLAISCVRSLLKCFVAFLSEPSWFVVLVVFMFCVVRRAVRRRRERLEPLANARGV